MTLLSKTRLRIRTSKVKLNVLHVGNSEHTSANDDYYCTDVDRVADFCEAEIWKLT